MSAATRAHQKHLPVSHVHERGTGISAQVETSSGIESPPSECGSKKNSGGIHASHVT